MQWVQANIAAFGGDPLRVFLVGQSAGADSVAIHLVRPQSWGLFSSGGLESGAFYPGWKEPTVASQRSSYELLLHQTGCKTAPNSVDCLVTFNASQLSNIAVLGQKLGVSWVPVLDGIEQELPGVRLAMQGQLAPGTPTPLSQVLQPHSLRYSNPRLSHPQCRFW